MMLYFVWCCSRLDFNVPQIPMKKVTAHDMIFFSHPWWRTKRNLIQSLDILLLRIVISSHTRYVTRVIVHFEWVCILIYDREGWPIVVIQTCSSPVDCCLRWTMLRKTLNERAVQTTGIADTSIFPDFHACSLYLEIRFVVRWPRKLNKSCDGDVFKGSRAASWS